MHLPYIANSLDLQIKSSRDILEEAMAALSDGPSLEDREKITSSIDSGRLIDDEIMINLYK